MAKTFEFTNNNYIKKYPELFEECLKAAMLDKLGTEQVTISQFITKSALKKIAMNDIPIFANTSIIDKAYPVPMLSENFKLKKEMNILLETAHERVKKKLAKMRKSGTSIPKSKSPKRVN